MKFFNRVALFSLALFSIGVQGGFAMGPAPSSSAAARDIYNEYGITVVAGSDVDSDGFEKAAKMIKAHFDRYYSPGFLKRSGVERIVIYHQFSYNGNVLGGLAEGHQVTVSAGVAAVVSDEPSLASICSNVVRGSTDDLNCRSARAVESGDFLKALDHEIFHVIDFNSMDAYQETSHWNTSWKATNPAGFEYMGSGFTYVKSGRTESLFSEKQPGFVSGYATASPLEDRAEVYSRYLTGMGQIRAQVRRDRIVGAKVKLIRGMLEELCRGDSSCKLPGAFKR